MNNIYDYPEYYELIFSERDFELECKFIDQIVKRFSKIKVNSILDIACGTGPHMANLAQMGYSIGGLDISKKMLSIIKESKEGRYKLYQKDMSDFKINDKYDACICMVNSLEILNGDSQLVSHFKSVSKSLNVGGIYFIELDHPSAAFTNPLPGEKIKEYHKTINKGGVRIYITYRKLPFDFENNLEKNELILDIDNKGKKLKLIDDSPVRRLTLGEVMCLAGQAGFELIKTFGDFNFDIGLNSPNAKRLIVVLRKK